MRRAAQNDKKNLGTILLKAFKKNKSVKFIVEEKSKNLKKHTFEIRLLVGSKNKNRNFGKYKLEDDGDLT